ncbi:MAG: prepilin-type N-terminal cleavage/methylation domain-containing protein [Candidatus Taylorbacteria bacterium]|nr:prepilin-type N-terminal cleavage/methylation domain-containing protein [Candidatus Taylorbacteria bacterium]
MRTAFTSRKASDAFTLMEVLLVVAVLGVVSAIGAVNLGNFSRGVELDSFAQKVVFDLRLAKAKSMSGEEGRKWGVRFVNGASEDYYEIYSTPTNYLDPAVAISSTEYLPRGVSFSDPAPLANDDVLFSKGFGTTTSQAIVLDSPQKSVTVTITSQGGIY